MHVEIQEVSTTLYQRRRGKDVNIIVMFKAYFLSTLFLSKIMRLILYMNFHVRKDSLVARYRRYKIIYSSGVILLRILVSCVYIRIYNLLWRKWKCFLYMPTNFLKDSASFTKSFLKRLCSNSVFLPSLEAIIKPNFFVLCDLILQLIHLAVHATHCIPLEARGKCC